MGNAVLKHQLGGGVYHDYELNKEVTTIGRSRSNEIVIKDPSISRLHIRVEKREGQYFALDNHSSNGTFINHQKIIEAPLKEGDMIIMGRAHFLFVENPKKHQRVLTPTAAGESGENEKVYGSPISMSFEDIAKGGDAFLDASLESKTVPAPPLFAEKENVPHVVAVDKSHAKAGTATNDDHPFLSRTLIERAESGAKPETSSPQTGKKATVWLWFAAAFFVAISATAAYLAGVFG